jgi:tRNA(Ile)-lysidine synthase
LNFSKKEILDFVDKNNLKWREDSTNKENDFTRNKIRNQIFPELEKMNKNF